MVRNMLYLITILIAICQVTLVNAISIGNIKPDLLLVWVIFVALDKGAVKAAMAGILAGFLKDVFSAGAFINTLSLPACGIAAGLVTEKFYIVKEKLSVQLLIVFAACVLDVIVQAFYFSNWQEVGAESSSHGYFYPSSGDLSARPARHE